MRKGDAHAVQIRQWQRTTLTNSDRSEGRAGLKVGCKVAYRYRGTLGRLKQLKMFYKNLPLGNMEGYKPLLYVYTTYNLPKLIIRF